MAFHSKYTITIWDAFMIVSILTVEKYLGKILTTGATKVENRARMTRFCTRKNTHIVCGVVLIIYRQCGRKIFPSNFDDLYGPRHYLSRLDEGEVQNRSRMTRFFTRNILTLFVVPFLLFPASMTSKCFCWILTTFSGSGTIKACWSRQSWKPSPDDLVLHQKIPTLFGVQFLSFVISMAEKCFGRFLTTFSSPSTIGAGIVENRA